MTDTLIDRIRDKQKKDRYLSLGYEDLLLFSGIDVIESKHFGSYQGDIAMIVEEPGQEAKIGYLVTGYGSCSGCDALEAAMPSSWTFDDDEEWPDSAFSSLVSLRDDLISSIIWAEDGQAVAEIVKTRERSGLDWYGEEKEMNEWLVEAALRADRRGYEIDP